MFLGVHAQMKSKEDPFKLDRTASQATSMTERVGAGHMYADDDEITASEDDVSYTSRSSPMASSIHRHISM